MHVVAAGHTGKFYTELCLKYNVSKLYSIMYEKGPIQKWPDGRWLMVDSGAHSWNKLTINKIGHTADGKNLPDIREHSRMYLDFISKFRHKRWIFVELDVYGVLPKEEIDEMYKEVMSYRGVCQYIRVYHPHIDNGSLKTLWDWIDQGQTFIGVGNDSTPYLPNIFDRTRDKIKIHGFAMTKFDLCKKFPFYSVDSTTTLSTMMYGSMGEFGLRMVHKSKMVKDRDYRALIDPKKRIELSIKTLKETEDYLTRLWEKRGVVWNDDWLHGVRSIEDGSSGLELQAGQRVHAGETFEQPKA